MLHSRTRKQILFCTHLSMLYSKDFDTRKTGGLGRLELLGTTRTLEPSNYQILTTSHAKRQDSRTSKHVYIYPRTLEYSLTIASHRTVEVTNRRSHGPSGRQTHEPLNSQTLDPLQPSNALHPLNTSSSTLLSPTRGREQWHVRRIQMLRMDGVGLSSLEIDRSRLEVNQRRLQMDGPGCE